MSVNADGKITEVDAAIVPASLWNAQLVKKTIALNSKDGSVMPVSVIDYGKEQLVLQGRPRRRTTIRSTPICRTMSGTTKRSGC